MAAGSRAWLLLVVVLGLAAGCGSPQKPETKTGSESAEPAKSIDLSSGVGTSVLGLIKNRRLIRVGDTAEKALEAFEKPDKARVLTEPPPNWPKDIRASGWEAEDRGFGLLLSNGRIVGALYSEYETTPERIAQIKSDYTNTFGPPEAVSDTKNVHYSFWEDAENRLAICSTMNSRGKPVITVCVGTKSVMDNLGFSLNEAKEESAKAEEILAEIAAKSH